jgi:alkanesulfonate monooxygenase SsuD/methylene tetrahydromethanopterin reductase-like flavin-dependent oxidoreductase (luciferase family)
VERSQTELFVVQVDLLLDPFGARWPEIREAARAAADAGFSGIWTWDHLDGRVYGAGTSSRLGPSSRLSPWRYPMS